MSIRLTAAILLTFALGQTAFAGTCEITPIANEKMKDRAASISFPDGRQITVIGHNHGDRSILLRALSLVQQPVNSKVIDQWQENFRSLLDDHNDAIRDTNQDLDFFRALKTNFPEAKFIGLEGDEKFVKHALQNYPGLYKDSLVALQRGISPREHEMTFSVATGAALFLKSTGAKALNGIRLVGMESSDAIAAENAATDDMMTTFTRLKGLYGLGPQFHQNVAKLHNELFERQLAGKLNAEEAEEEMLKRLPKYFSAQDEVFAKSILQSILRHVKSNDRRDQAVAEALVNRKESGVHVTGKLHLQSTLQKLKLLCEQTPARTAFKSDKGRASVGRQ